MRLQVAANVTHLNVLHTWHFQLFPYSDRFMSKVPTCFLAAFLAIASVGHAQVSGVLREVWTNTDGSTVPDLTSSPNYPEAPVLRVVDADFRAPVNFTERYGVRMRAYLTPTTAGDYTFWVSGDDTCELWLSSDDTPANRVRIARSTSYTNPLAWNTYSSQRSTPITLVAGQRYYIEALMKETTGGDHLAVAWATSPSGPAVVIPGAVLTPFEIPGPVPTGVTVEAGRPIIQYAPNLNIVANAQALDMTSIGRTVTAAWTQVSGAAAVIATPTALTTGIRLPGPGTFTFRATGTTTAGSASDILTVTILPKLAADAGTALSEYWFGVNGKPLSALTSSLDYPNFPHGHRVVTSLTSAVNQGDQFGSRTRGFILVPTTGDYRFYLAADETAEFYLSTDATTANLQLRASVAAAVGVESHFQTPAQASGPIALVAGQRYAFEIRHKEEGSTDHVSLIWQKPGTDYAEDITTEYLAPPPDAAAVIAGTQPFDMVSDYVLNAGRDQCIYLPQRTVALSAYESRRFWASDVPTRAWSKVSGPGTVTFTAPTTTATSATFSAAGTYILKYAVTTSRNVSVDTVKVEVRAAFSATSGFLTRQVWWNKNYATIAALKADVNYPNFPDITDNVTELRQTSDWGSLYGTRVTGLLRIPANGTNTTPVNYTFYVSGDDLAEFSISTDANPANLQRVCYTTRATGREVWNLDATQTSAPIALKPGSSYFVELVHKETYSSDYFAVAWTKDGDRRPRVIDGGYFEPAQAAPTFSQTVNLYASAGRDRKYWWPHDRTRLTGSVLRVHDTPNAQVVNWTRLSGPAATIVSPTELATDVTLTGPGTYTFQLAVTDGAVTHRDSVVITVAAAQTGVTGFLTRSVWFDVDGNTVASLRTMDANLAYPHLKDNLPGAEAPENWADYIGTRLKGTLKVPVSGIYYLSVTSNEAADLSFDTKDGNGLQRIAYNDHSEGVRTFDAHTYQKSAPLNLFAGVSYPIELLHKELTGSDHFSVAFEGPATNGRELLSRGFIAPESVEPVFNPEITVALGGDRTLLWPTDEVTLAAIVYDLKLGPQPLTYRWSCTRAGVTFDSPTSAVSGLKFSGPGTYEIKMTVSDGANTGVDTVLLTVSNPLAANSGGILREAWTNVSGYTVNDLKNSAAYQKSPTFTDVLETFETPTNWADNYGQRLTGTLQVPAEADYHFFIASDDESELWLNAAGETAAGATKIAFTTSGTGQYAWTNRASQKSAAIHLVPGRRYYIQAMHKEGNSSDYLAVAYRRVDQPNAAPVIIPGVMLSPPTGTVAGAFDGQMAVEAGTDLTGVWPKARYALKGTAVDYVPGPQPLAYRWSVISAPSGAAARVIFNAPTALTTDVEFPSAGTYKLQLSATDGLVSRTDTLTVSIGAQLAVGTGTILAERYNGITGSWVTDLTKNAKYPGTPDARAQLRTAEIPSNTGDNYGMLIRGYLHAPASGIYRLNLASDDWAEVFLSTDRTPENKALACFVPAGTDYYEWRKYPDYQLSRPIALAAGGSYYIEIRFKESSSRDHLALAWLRPGTTAFEVIDGAYLSPWKLADGTAPTIVLTGGSDVTVQVGAGTTYVDPGFTATDGVDGNINGSVRVEGTVNMNVPGTYVLRYVVTDASGNQSTVAIRRVTVAVAANQQPIYPADSSGTHSTTAWPRPSVASITEKDASRFLKQATFGPSTTSIARVKAIGYDAWLNEQIALAPTLHLPMMDQVARYEGARQQVRDLATTAQAMSIMPGSMMPVTGMVDTNDRLYTWWTTAATSPDQLRQRVAFALSEVLVISDQGPALQNYPRGVTNYYDILVKRAFGNYRDILEEITLNPIMGMWLTMMRSQKTQPDENYAREIMQLFSIGLAHLNKDGTFKRDGDGNAIPTYTQTEINELARAFTGWTFSGSRYFDYASTPVDDIKSMMPFEDRHDRGEKVFLGGSTIPAGQDALQDVRRAVDVVFNHPNVGPFLARHFIQRLVTSNPSPAYVYRVSLKFDNNGAGVRGDLGALVKAVLMDPEARTAPANGGGPTKLSEPIVRLTRLLRAFPKAPSDNPPTLGRYLLSNVRTYFVQSPLQANTVFNFFHPDYKPPGLPSPELVAPEFEIATELSVVDTANYFFDSVRSGFPSDSSPRVALDLAPLTALMGSPDQLITKLETLLLARPMSTDLRNALLAVQGAYASSPTEALQNMLALLCASPEFTVDR